MEVSEPDTMSNWTFIFISSTATLVEHESNNVITEDKRIHVEDAKVLQKKVKK